jgi:phosphatidylglycerol:prolipoprotein diacylglycerol transferase
VFTPPLSSVQLGLTTRHYLSHPLDILAFWVGGFGIPGAILGGALALYLISRRDKLPLWDLLDVLTPGFLIAQIIGRLGNYFNQELYGAPANVSWGILISPEHRLSGYEGISHYHPLFAYEMILNLACLAFIYWLAHGNFSDRGKAGGLFLVYLFFTSLTRFMLEFIRLDVSLVNGINANQLFFAAAFLLSGIGLFRRRLAPVL